MFKKYIGDREFYKRVIVLTLPIMIQNGITNFVNMLDNVMVGRVGTTQMTGVAISNQLIFVFNLCIFGAISGAGIFGAQFFGNGDHKGVRDTFRFKMLFCSILCVLGILIFIFFGDNLINLYLKGEGNTADVLDSFKYAKKYLLIMLIGLLPYTWAQCYSSTLRESGQALLPMTAGVVAVIVNLVLNYILIFGKFGFTAMGAEGAATATVISRFAELIVVSVWTRVKDHKNPFIIGAYKSFKIPMPLVKNIVAKGMPLMINETFWASGMATLSQCYSVRGLSVVAANNICQTFFNVFSVAFLSLGVAIGIILGQILGSGDNQKAKDYSRKLIALSVMVSVIICIVYIIAAEFIPQIYNTNNEVRNLATKLMQICALAMPLDAFANASYFTLRSGGKVTVTLIFDSGFVWCIAVPVTFILSRFTSLPILALYAVSQGLNLIKCVLGYIFVKKGSWIKTIIK